jgi:hypothetical protein
MKKILTIIAVLALLFPVSAMAGMTAITDSEMSDVTGQVGIDISVVDFSMDMSIANISWGDGDSGTLVASNRDVAYGPGYFNIQGIDMYIYVTLNGSPIFTAAPGSLDLAGVKYGIASITGQHFIAAQPFGIDILTASTVVADNPYEATWGVTGVLFSIPDMYITIDEFRIAGLYLTDSEDVTTAAFLEYAEEYEYSLTASTDSTESLGSLLVSGIEITMYSSVPFTTTVEGVDYKSAYKLVENAGASERWYPGNRAWVIISPH